MIYKNEITIRIKPTKKNAVVKYSFYNKAISKEYNKKIKRKNNISLSQYDSILYHFNRIDGGLLKYPKTGKDSLGRDYISMTWFDAATNSITYKKGKNITNIYGRGLYFDYEYFYSTVKLIVETTEIPIEKINY